MKSSFIIHGTDDDPTPQVFDQLVIATERGDMYRAKQEHNQDRIATGSFSFGEQTLLVDMVCDGLGGYGRRDGEKASQALSESLRAVCESLDQFPEYPLHEIVEPMLARAASTFSKLQMDSAAGGTTFVLVVSRGDDIQVFHIGDSRAFFFKPDGSFIVQTEDHKPEGFEYRFKLTHYIHDIDTAELMQAVRTIQLKRSDYPEGLLLLLTSDGISDNLMTSVDDRECHPQLSQLIQEHFSTQDTEQLCRAIMNTAKERMTLAGTDEGARLDVKPDNSTLLLRWYS